MRLASAQALGSSALQARFSRGISQYMLIKLAAISTPEMLKVQGLCRESATSHGKDESADATVAPKPMSTNKEGRAQHRSELSEVNSEK
jgi:hypothetical protein